MELISIHIPKTAGTAFTKVLTQNYGEQKVYLDYADWKLDPNDRQFAVVHGHFRAKRYKNDFPDAKWIAWLRDPVKRVISHYYFVKNSDRCPNNPLSCALHENDLTLAEFAALQPVRNLQTKFIRGMAPEDFYFLGIQEHFREDLATLGAMLRWRYAHAPLQQLNAEPGYRKCVQAHLADKRLVRRIRAINSLDMKLYNRALAIRAARPPVVVPFRTRLVSAGLRRFRSLFRDRAA